MYRGWGGGFRGQSTLWEISRFKWAAKSPTHNQGSTTKLASVAELEPVKLYNICGSVRDICRTKSRGLRAKLPAAEFTTAKLSWHEPPLQVLNKIRGEGADVIYKQRNAAANICYELGEYQNEQRAYEKAMTFYNEALKQDETHDKSMLALAKLYLRKGELEGCEHQCNALLRCGGCGSGLGRGLGAGKC